MAGALGLVITTDVSIAGGHAIPVYVDDSLPIVGPSRACVVTTGEVPQAGGASLAVRLAPAGTPAIGPALAVYVVPGGGSLGGVGSTLLNGLISYWKLDEASGVALDSAGANTLTDNNTVTSAVGKVGTSRQFTAANSEWLSGAAPTMSGAYSVALWAYATTLNGGLFKSLRDTNGFIGDSMIQVESDGALSFYNWRINGTDTTGRHKTAAGVAVANAWQHIVCVWDGAASLIYVDNTLIGHSASGVSSGWGAEFVIGRIYTSATYYWNGRIDDVKLWNRGLIASEIAEDYANGLAGRALL
jgi:hypothetical protein